MTIPSVDTTTLTNLSPNLDVGDIADPALRLAVFQYIYAELAFIVAELNSIPTANYQNLSVTTAKLAEGAVTNSKVADGVLTAAKFVAGALTNETQNALRITELQAETIHIDRFPRLGSEVDDTAGIRRMFASITSNSPARFNLGGRLLTVSDTIIIPSYVIVDGENAVVTCTDATKDIFNTWGFETTIENIKFVGGKRGIVLENTNVDLAILIIDTCEFDNQADYQIKTIGAISSTLTIKNCKFNSYNGILDATCDQTVMRDCRANVYTNGIKYIKNGDALIMENVLLVPAVTLDNTTYWIQNNGHYLLGESVRFSGENAGIRALYQDYTVSEGVYGVVDFDTCYFWGSNSDIILHQHPQKLIVKNSTVVGSAEISSDVALVRPLNAVFDVDLGVNFSSRAIEPIKGLEVNLNQLSQANIVSSNSTFFDFATTGTLGTGGSVTATAEMPPFGNLNLIFFGTLVDRLYKTYLKSFSSLTSGYYTAACVIKSDKEITLTIGCGDTRKEIKIPPSTSFNVVSVSGFISPTFGDVSFDIYDPPANTNVYLGSPMLMNGIVKNPIQTTPNTSTLVIGTNQFGFPAAAAPPVDGFWHLGSVLYNSVISVGTYEKWEAVTTGTPGTWNGVNQRGALKNTTANRPISTLIYAGYLYIDTTLVAAGKPIWWTGTAWVDATGVAV